jgi:putative phosphonate metabolism protein
MSDFPRYAIYYAPAADSALARFGAELLSYDAVSGADVPVPPDVLAEAPDWLQLVKDPRKYGFHATLKAPFPLRDDRTEIELIAACEKFSAIPRIIPIIAPLVRTISGFTAVVPSEQPAELVALAQDCVETFDDFRAPMTAEDRARRKPETMTPRQVAQLDRFGYPYVGDDFRFHMTLTSRLPPERSAPVRAMLETRFATLAIASLGIDRIALFRQPTSSSRFQILRSFALTPA